MGWARRNKAEGMARWYGMAWHGKETGQDRAVGGGGVWRSGVGIFIYTLG